MPNIVEYREQRAAAVLQMRNLVSSAEAAGRDLTPEETARFDELRTQERALAAKVERAEALAEMERSLAAPAIVGAGNLGDRSFEALEARCSFTRAIASCIPHSGVTGGVEAEVSAELARRMGRAPRGMFLPVGSDAHPFALQQRTQMAGQLSTGGALVGETHRPDLLIDLLRPKTVTALMGATTLTGLTGSVVIPKQTGSTTTYWVAENEDVAESDTEWGAVRMTPHTVAARTQYTRSMILNATPSIEAILRADFAANIAEAVDSAALLSSSSAKIPNGILGGFGGGVQAIGFGTNGGAPTYAKMVEFMSRIDTANANGGALGWVLTPQAKAKLATVRKLPDATDSDTILDLDAGTLLGKPYATTTLLPANGAKGNATGLSALIFGDWSQLLVGYWSALDVLVNPYATGSYEKGNVQIVAFLDVDVACRHPEALVTATDMVTTL